MTNAKWIYILIKNLFGPPGCTTAGAVQRPIVLRTVRTSAVSAFRTIRISAGAFSGRPATRNNNIVIYIFRHSRGPVHHSVH